MAPWSFWSQSASQQQKEQQHQHQQQESPSSSPPPMTSPPSSLNQTPALPSTEPLTPKVKNHGYRERPSPTELREIAAKSLQTGMVAGGFGLLMGAGSGIMRSAPPTLFAIFAGLQWFTLGSTFIASRGLLHHAWGGEENLSSSDLLAAGGIAGGVSGMVGGMIRGPRNVLPGIIVFSTLGAGNAYVSQLLRGTGSKRETSWLDSKWSPMQRLSDKDYLDKIEEKIIRLDADIAIIDENIASLKEALQSSAPSTESTK
ncbi:hypothetical protein RRF57_007445 [Xylaria bambusicola]|uniref:Uncharacterized protein n=1 Tax=Xylaria bambusicola TaxID=326684 RepID=A0AAN7ZAF2_9PEZI